MYPALLLRLIEGNEKRKEVKKGVIYGNGHGELEKGKKDFCSRQK